LRFLTGADEPAIEHYREFVIEAVDRQLVDDFAEEPAHQQTFGPVSSESAALEVVEMFFFEGSDRRPMTTDHVITENLEIGDRVGFGIG
jgi:hypothetical protein